VSEETVNAECRMLNAESVNGECSSFSILRHVAFGIQH